MNILDSFIEGAQHFSPRNREKIYRAIIEYMYFGFEPDFLKNESLGYFEAIKPSLQKHRSRVEAGRIGGKQTSKQTGKQTPSKTQANRQANAKQTAKQKGSDNDNEYDNELIAKEITKEKSGFEEAWSLYPRKAGKQPALNAYSKALKEGHDPADILAGVARFAEWCRATRQDPKYIPHGSTWFSQHRWEDDLGDPSTWVSQTGLMTDFAPDYSEEGW